MLAGGAALDGGAVRHEMVHALLRVGTHPRREFLDRCGGTVDCGRDCVADAGPAPSIDPTATVIAPSQLKLSIAVAPETPATRIDDGFFSVMALATNVLDHPVVVRLPNSSSSTLGVSYTYHVQGPDGGIGGGGNAIDSSGVYFAAGETKRHEFDFRVGRDSASGELLPGDYAVSISFGLAQPWAAMAATFRE